MFCLHELIEQDERDVFWTQPFVYEFIHTAVADSSGTSSVLQPIAVGWLLLLYLFAFHGLECGCKVIYYLGI